MIVQGQELQTIRYDASNGEIWIIDQTQLPHDFVLRQLRTLDDACDAIVNMQVRGAPLIGITAAYGVYLALKASPAELDGICVKLAATRPTAVNLQWALERVQREVAHIAPEGRALAALAVARTLQSEDASSCSRIGDHGLKLLRELWQRKQEINPRAERLNILTHCNAGWLATADWGTALAPIYKAALAGIPVHVWVDETRPRNQGASLTAWELSSQKVGHTVIVDNAGGHLMQHGQVDVCLVGSDRTTSHGDVCNKIGTYLKALAAADNQIPFYAALPVSTIDFALRDGVKEIPIEERSGHEITHMWGRDAQGQVASVQVTPEGTAVSNFGFDVTPARLVTGLITEFGVFPASPEGLTVLRRHAGKETPAEAGS